MMSNQSNSVKPKDDWIGMEQRNDKGRDVEWLLNE